MQPYITCLTGYNGVIIRVRRHCSSLRAVQIYEIGGETYGITANSIRSALGSSRFWHEFKMDKCYMFRVGGAGDVIKSILPADAAALQINF